MAQNKQNEVEWVIKAAEQGHANAQSKLGVCFQQCEGVEQDMKEAVEWYSRRQSRGMQVPESAY